MNNSTHITQRDDVGTRFERRCPQQPTSAIRRRNNSKKPMNEDEVCRSAITECIYYAADGCAVDKACHLGPPRSRNVAGQPKQESHKGTLQPTARLFTGLDGKLARWLYTNYAIQCFHASNISFFFLRSLLSTPSSNL